MSDKIRKYVLPNLPYLFVFWFFSKIGTAYRIAPGTDFGTKLMGMLDTFPKAFESYWPGLGGIDLLVGLAGAAGVYLLIQSKIRQAKKFRRDAEYGTARFGTKEDMPSGVCEPEERSPCMNKIDKLDKELEKAREKAAEWQAKIRELEKQKQEEENSQIVQAVRSLKLTPAQLMAFLNDPKNSLTASGHTDPKPEAPEKEDTAHEEN